VRLLDGGFGECSFVDIEIELEFMFFLEILSRRNRL
jgi:hypothetical protein